MHSRAQTQRREILRFLEASAPTKWPHPCENVQYWEAYADFVGWNRWDLLFSRMDAILDGMVGNVREVARLVRPEVYAKIRSAFAEAEPLEAIIGSNDPKDGFRMGLAGLESQESRAFELSLRFRRDGHPDLVEIARHMDRRRKRSKRHTRAQSWFGQPEAEAPEEAEEPMPLETVYAYLKRAWRKLRALFGVSEAPGGTSQLTTSITHSNLSTSSPGASEPPTTTLRILPRTPSGLTSAGPSAMATSYTTRWPS